MPNTAQQDYIIISWEGKDYADTTKKPRLTYVGKVKNQKYKGKVL